MRVSDGSTLQAPVFRSRATKRLGDAPWGVFFSLRCHRAICSASPKNAQRGKRAYYK